GPVRAALRSASPSRAAPRARRRRAMAASSSTVDASSCRTAIAISPVSRCAEWDLSAVDLVDERTGNVLARLYPQDKTQNASGLRRSLEPLSPPPEPAHRP